MKMLQNWFKLHFVGYGGFEKSMLFSLTWSKSNENRVQNWDLDQPLRVQNGPGHPCTLYWNRAIRHIENFLQYLPYGWKTQLFNGICSYNGIINFWTFVFRSVLWLHSPVLCILQFKVQNCRCSGDLQGHVNHIFLKSVFYFQLAFIWICIILFTLSTFLCLFVL